MSEDPTGFPSAAKGERGVRSSAQSDRLHRNLKTGRWAAGPRKGGRCPSSLGLEAQHAPKVRDSAVLLSGHAQKWTHHVTYRG